jgi:hypothetical protein
MAMSALCMSLFLQGKPDLLHLAYILGPMAMAWALAIPPKESGSPTMERRAVGTGVSVLAAAVLFHLSFLVYHIPEGWEFADVDRPTRDAPVNRWLRAQPWLLPEDTLAAFPEGGQIYLYTRPSAVSHTLLHPLSDRLNGPSDHSQTAKELLERRPRCILLTAEREADYLDRSSPVAGVILSHYERFAVVSDAVVYRLRSGS